jgi:hypothetical protein
MKKLYFLAFAVLGLAASGQVIIQDGFESYANGPYYGGHWSNWSQSSGATSEHIIVSEDRAFTGTKSGFIGDSGNQDALLVFPMMTSGVHSFEFKIFIPEGRTGYYNFQNTLANLGIDGNWGNQIHLGTTLDSAPIVTPGVGRITGTEFFYEFTYPENEWFTVTHVIDLDELVVRFYINDVEIETFGNPIGYPGDNLSIEAMDFYSHTNNNWYYVDDIVVMHGDITMATNDVTKGSTINVAPTLAKDFVTVSSKDVIKNVSVFNMNGQQVVNMAGKGTNMQLNVSHLPAGTYVVKTTTDKETKATKIVVK